MNDRVLIAAAGGMVVASLFLAEATLRGESVTKAADAAEQENRPADPQQKPCDDGRVWKLHLKLSAEEYQALQPPAGFGFPAPPNQGPPNQNQNQNPARRADQKPA